MTSELSYSSFHIHAILGTGDCLLVLLGILATCLLTALPWPWFILYQRRIGPHTNIPIRSSCYHVILAECYLSLSLIPVFLYVCCVLLEPCVILPLVTYMWAGSTAASYNCIYHHAFPHSVVIACGSGSQKPFHEACRCSWRCRGFSRRRWSSRTSCMRRNVDWRRWWKWWDSATRCTGCRGSSPALSWCSSPSCCWSLYSRYSPHSRLHTTAAAGYFA